MSASVVWVPPVECGCGGRLAPPVETLLDTVHTDLIDPENGKARWEGASLLASVSSTTTTLFLNDFKEADEAITVALLEKCTLRVVCFVECGAHSLILYRLAALCCRLPLDG